MKTAREDPIRELASNRQLWKMCGNAYRKGIKVEDITAVMKGALDILGLGGTWEQSKAFASDYWNGKAKPIETYL